MKHRNLFLAALLATMTPLASAHGVWVAERLGEPTIVLGEGASDDAYDPAQIRWLKAYDDNAQPLDITPVKHEKNATLPKNEQMGSVAFLYDNGYWTEQKDGEWVQRPKNEVADAKRSGHYLKTALSVLKDGDLPDAAALKALPLVIIPQDDVLDTHAGDDIDVTVYYNGKPLAGAKIMGDFLNDMDNVVAQTDEDGEASVPVRNNGLNVIAVSHSVDAPAEEQAKGEKVGYLATLSFNNHPSDH